MERYDGTILLDGQDIMALSDDEYRSQVRWKKISMVFQGAMNALSPTIRVGSQVAEPLMVHQGMQKEEAMVKAQEGMKLVGLPEYVAQRYPHELSGGMKQRVVIAMALILRPPMVILDEPTSALDVMTQANIMNLLKSLKKEHQLSYIFITHDLGLASELADQAATMYAGRIVEIGPSDEVYTKPLHPYTERLLASVPRLRREEAPEFIPGAPPDLTHPPAGCRFHPRCPKAFEACGWTSDEIAERLRQLAQGDSSLPPMGRIETPEPDRVHVLPPPGAKVSPLATGLNEILHRNPWGERGFKAISLVGPAPDGVDIWLYEGEEPRLVSGGAGSKAACWLVGKEVKP